MSYTNILVFSELPTKKPGSPKYFVFRQPGYLYNVLREKTRGFPPLPFGWIGFIADKINLSPMCDRSSHIYQDY